MESPPLKTTMFVHSLERLWAPSCLLSMKIIVVHQFLWQENLLSLYIYIYMCVCIYIYLFNLAHHQFKDGFMSVISFLILPL